MATAFGEKVFCYVKYTCKPGKRQACMDAINEKKIQERYQAQPGNIEYSFYMPTNSADTFFLVDIWDDQEHFDAHLKSDVPADFAPIKAQFVDKTELVFQLGGK